MTTSNVARNQRGALLPALIGAAALVLAACGGGGVEGVAGAPASSGDGGSGGGGGGTTVTPTSYALYASNYVVYSSQTNGAYLHSVQGGDVYGFFAGNLNYGCYSFGQPQIDSTQFYALQAQADSNGGGSTNSCAVNSSVVPSAAGDVAGVTIKAPGTNSTSAASVAPLDISQATKLLIQMGNIYTQGDVPNANGGNAKVFTIILNNDTSAAQDGSGQTARCAVDQTLATVGRGAAAPLGVLNYVIPLSSFTTCSKGSISTLQSTGVTSVTVQYSGDKNSINVGDLDVIAVGYVGFTK